MKIITYLLCVSFFLILLIFFEGFIPNVWDFHSYTLVGWITQILLLIIIFTGAAKIIDEP